MIIVMIAALAENRVIGGKNGLLWHLPADFKHFKEKTIGKTIVMGLKTFASIGNKPLPHREHIILSKDPVEPLLEHCHWASSVEEVLQIAERLGLQENDELMICGGGMVYQQFLPHAHRLYLTYVHAHFEGDVLFPEVNLDDWKEVSRERREPDEKNAYPYSFVILERKA